MLVGLSAVVIGAVCVAMPASQAATPSAATGASAVHTSTDSRQLADEITRRLRRMGFDMIKNRQARPSETVGEYC